MSDIKISDKEMEEMIEREPIRVVHNYDEIIKKKADIQEQINQLTNVIKDLDLLIIRMENVGCELKVEAEI